MIRNVQIFKMGVQNGISFTTVTMDMDERTSLPAGSASVELALGVEVAVAMKGEGLREWARDLN